MRMNAFLLLTLFAGMQVSCQQPQNDGNGPETPAPGAQPKQILFGDPFIMLHEGTYYMYGTSGEDGILVYKSSDLLNWEGPAGVKDGYALHKDDVWGEKWFWAPEVYFMNGKFYMYFSAEEHINAAVSDSPEGPFVQEEESPMLESKAIDNHLFIDKDGKPYMYFVNFGEGLSVWVAEMNEDLLSFKKETMKQCIRQSQDWEREEGIVNEGPYVMNRDGVYYLFYSGNGYTSQQYGVGFATADNPYGPWEKFAGNPILQSPDTLRGVGHGAFFEDVSGKLHYVYHAHNSQDKIHPRKVYISECKFTEQAGSPFPVPEMAGPRVAPVIRQGALNTR